MKNNITINFQDQDEENLTITKNFEQMFDTVESAAISSGIPTFETHIQGSQQLLEPQG